MSDAESTVKFAIFDAISSNWHKKDPNLMRDEIFKKIFQPHLKWAVKEYLSQLDGNPPNNDVPIPKK